jgi:hypothetical protein
MDTLGVTSSVLYDVTIINDTLAYAVGEMYLRDSLGNLDLTPYGVAIWNGSNWQARRVMVTSQQGDVHSRVFRGVFAFSATDVWFGDGNAFHWDGQGAFATAYWISGYPGNPTPVLGPNQGVHEFWGTSSSNLYGVGVNGGIAHYNGSTWQRMESGTDVDLLDVWGSPDGSIVWACGWEDFKPTVLLRYQGGTWEKVYEDPFPFVLRQDSLSGVLGTLWTLSRNRLYVVSHYGPYRCPADTRGPGKRFSFTSGSLPGFPYRLRGNATNEITLVGGYSMIAHFNGIGWRYYSQLFDNDGSLRSVAQQGDLVVAVGLQYGAISSRALVIRGRR